MYNIKYKNLKERIKAMTDKEMALQITLKAIESGMIYKSNGDTRTDINKNTAESIADFFTTIFKTVCNAEDVINDAAQ